jgi:hypothetical protein
LTGKQTTQEETIMKKNLFIGLVALVSLVLGTMGFAQTGKGRRAARGTTPQPGRG